MTKYAQVYLESFQKKSQAVMPTATPTPAPKPSVWASLKSHFARPTPSPTPMVHPDAATSLNNRQEMIKGLLNQ